ncbi:MerR family transcriptional regulator [Halobacillus massiliensis]|uniref:MerR family transcriptional regulator n=1 Tax=Halobacillus massiliensis TaxID=1926286 RepID=UPI0015C45679|nr:MerR family transcriptional regulator [Halobacillus massiliensis]
MTDNINDPEIAASAAEVCKTLDIKDSTLRKYALLLKKHGYNFNHDSTGKRYYLNNDVMLLRRLKQLKSNGGMTLEQAAETVIKWANETVIKTPKEDTNIRYNNDIKDLKETVAAQNDLLKELFNRLDQQDKKIDKRFDQMNQSLEEYNRERQEQFRKELEQYRLEAPAEAEQIEDQLNTEMKVEAKQTEEEASATSETKNKKSWISRLFKG